MEATLCLPIVSPFVESYMVDWRRGRVPSQRPPRAHALQLAFVSFLKEDNRPFPPREVVAKHLGISIPSVDVFLSQAEDEGEITIERGYRPGNVKQRPSTIKVRWVIPSPEVYDSVMRADRLEHGLSG